MREERVHDIRGITALLGLCLMLKRFEKLHCFLRTKKADEQLDAVDYDSHLTQVELGDDSL